MKAPNEEIYGNQRKEHNVVEKYIQWLTTYAVAGSTGLAIASFV